MINNFYRCRGKRILDVFLTILALFLLFPLLLLSAKLVQVRFGSAILVRQQRPGLNGRPFTIYKFRTMLDVYDPSGNLLPDSERIDWYGWFLRSTSIDELPELFNVIKGEMSIVGPRPLLMRYLNRYTPEQSRRHQVKPGITGLAQINGRNAITWEEKFKLDIWYVDNQSLWLDLKIIALTILKIVKREGINQPGQATVEEFNPQIKRINIDC
jgi:sugar transferase EpsL